MLTLVGGDTFFVRQSSGNLLLQALLALTVVFAFIPFLTGRFSGRDSDARMYAATRQVETAQTAARIFIRENAALLPYDTTVVAGNNFADTLEAYGLPLGFVPRTALGQDIALIITKSADDVSAHLELTGGNLTELQRAELARRIGFYATYADASVLVGIPLSATYSDVVRRNEPDINNSAFLTDLDMGDFSLRNASRIIAQRGDFETGQFGTLAVTGSENGRKERNQIKKLTANKTVFQTRTGESALSLTRGTLTVDSANVRTIASFGDTGNMTAGDASVYDFNMTAGRTNFSGPAKWDVRGNVVTEKINFSVERLDVDAYITTTRGQDVYITDDLESSTRSGIDVGILYASNITLRDQTSSALSNGGAGPVVLDIRPAEVSVLPDALVADVNNDAFQIIANPTADTNATVDCKSVIGALKKRYNRQSLSQYLICQYVYWARLERRIDIKQCMISGNGNCE